MAVPPTIEVYPFSGQNSTVGVSRPRFAFSKNYTPALPTNNLIPDILREPFGRYLAADISLLRLVVSRRADGGELHAHDAEIQKPARLLVARASFRLAGQHIGERRHFEDLRARRTVRYARLLLGLSRDVAEKAVRRIEGARGRVFQIRRALAHRDRHVDFIGEARLGLVPRDVGHVHRSEEHTSELQSRFGI